MALFRYLRVKKEPDQVVPDAAALSAEQLAQDASLPITLRQISNLPDNVKRRIYRAVLPPDLVGRLGIDPVSWQGPHGDQHIMDEVDYETTEDGNRLTLVKRLLPAEKQ